MTVCTACGTESPDDLRHCPQCGALLPEPDAPGNTSHFGEKDLKNLMSRIERDAAPEAGPGNLMAGLPRPKVGSMASPLRGGQTAPTDRGKPEKRTRSASGSTVMGMPLFTTGEQRAIPVPARRRPTPSSQPADPAPAAGGPSIQSLGSFQDDIGASAPADPASEPALPAVDGGDGEAAREPSAPAADAPPEPAEVTPPQDPPRREAPSLPPRGALDVRSPDRPTEPSPQVGGGGGGRVVVVIVIAAALAAAAFFLLK